MRNDLRIATLAVLLCVTGCAVTVVDGGTSSGDGGAPPSPSSSPSSTAPGSGGAAPACAQQDATSCSCTEGKLRISCSPKNGKSECVCSFSADFSGICFEKDPSALCNFESGCCANYFSGQ
jgi:hypothetical protein